MVFTDVISRITSFERNSGIAQPPAAFTAATERVTFMSYRWAVLTNMAAWVVREIRLGQTTGTPSAGH